MIPMLASTHYHRLEALRQLTHARQGEVGTISLMRRDSVNGLVESLSIEKAWFYDEADADGRRLPEGVRFELQVAEELITSDDLKQLAAIQHGDIIFKILAPSPFRPTGLQRFWRFWLTEAETEE